MSELPPPSIPAIPPERLLEAAMDGLDACVALTDPQGRVVYVNGSWSSYSGSNPLLAGVIPGADYKDVCQRHVKGEESHLSIVALGIIGVLSGNVPRVHLDYPVTESGGVRWYAMVGTHSKVPGLGAVIQQRDITERMGLERRLRRSEGLFHITTENALDLIAILGLDGMARYHSPSHRKALGYSEMELMDLDFGRIVHEEDRELYFAALNSGVETGLSRLFEYRMLHRDGSYCHFEAQAAGVENPMATSETVLLISRDITQRKAAELERARMEVQLRHAQKMEAVGQLAAGIAHEINTPVQFVGDNLRFLGDAFQGLERVVDAAALGPEALSKAREEADLSYLCEEVPKAIRQSIDGLERVSTIVKAMKVFSHPGTEGMVALDLNQAIENTLIVSRNEWKYVAEVKKYFDKDLPRVVCIPGEFNQVILNLVVNAAHAIGDALGPRPDRRGTISIRTGTQGEWVEIRVEDTGTGIPETLRSQIWLPFFTTKPVGKGTGQGLAIVHSVVARHGGELAVESEMGVGTSFIVRLPLIPPERQGAP